MRMKVENAPSRKVVFREVKIPSHRMSPLEEAWMEIHTAIIEHTKQIDFVRIDTNGRRVEFKATLDAPEEILGLRKRVGLVEAFALGFELVDAIGFLVWDRLDVESSPIHFSGDRLSRAVARLESRKYAITHITNTKVLVEDSQFHMLGGAEQMLVALYMAISIMKGSSVETVC